MSLPKEWLETDGLGGFAMGTTDGIARRRYHGLLTSAIEPPTARVALVNALDSFLEINGEQYALSSHFYTPDIIHPDGERRIVSFDNKPWPTWCFDIKGECKVVEEVFMHRGLPAVFIRWKLLDGGKKPAVLKVRPLLSGRDYHLLRCYDYTLNLESEVSDNTVSWRLSQKLPLITAVSNGQYQRDPEWYYNFSYEEEKHRGFDFIEDLAAPGVFTWDISKKEALLVITSDYDRMPSSISSLKRYFDSATEKERKRRTQHPSPLDRAVDAYLVEGTDRKSIIAGYPWFTDWGRDTFIAMRGLCIATERFRPAEQILLSWAGVLSEGMLPNRFPEQGSTPDYNSADASLWFIIAAYEYLAAVQEAGQKLSRTTRRTLLDAIDTIITAFADGTRHGIACDEDGLLAVGEPGSQLTWMDAQVDGVSVISRVGKPVEIQALWLNSLLVGHLLFKRWKRIQNKGLKSFSSRFWNEKERRLYDVVDLNHKAGLVDSSFRPNQIFAVGGLPVQIIDDAQARSIVDAVETQLLTPMGLRSLAPDEAAYCPRYRGDASARDRAYHQGTVWPWLIGAFVEAWLRTRGNSTGAKLEAKERFLSPLLAHLDEGGLGHFSEIFDAEPPHTPRGCPFQAWSLGEIIRLERKVLSVAD